MSCINSLEQLSRQYCVTSTSGRVVVLLPQNNYQLVSRYGLVLANNANDNNGGGDHLALPTCDWKVVSLKTASLAGTLEAQEVGSQAEVGDRSS